MNTGTGIKRLYKSRRDRMIDGVCGGIAQYFDLDATLVRITWVLLSLFGGSGILLYIVAMIIMPAEPVSGSTPTTRSLSTANHKLWGFLLIALGIIFLAGNFGFSIWSHWWGLSWDVVLSLGLILAGVAFLFGGRNSLTTGGEHAASGSSEHREESEVSEPVPDIRRLHRSRTERKVFGVCGGLAEYLDIDPTIVRILFVVSAFASFGITLLLYIIMAIIVPDDPVATQAS